MLLMHVYIRKYGYTSMLYVNKHCYSLIAIHTVLLNMYGMKIKCPDLNIFFIASLK